MVPSTYLFEDDRTGDLSPLALTRPVFDLRLGAGTLRSRFERFWGSPVHVLCRPWLAETFRQVADRQVNDRPRGTSLFVNGRLIADAEILAAIRSMTENERLVADDGSIVAVRVAARELERFDLERPWSFTPSSPQTKRVKARLIRYAWDLLKQNSEAIVDDARGDGLLGTITGTVDPRATITDPSRVYVAPGARIRAGAVLDASGGPILIGPGSDVMANAAILGPVAIGSNSLIKMGAKIYGGTTIGDVCKVGGEIENSIFQGHANKQHEGFLGHSYIGAWCNLGADTNNSDLKNNYQPVDVVLNGTSVETGELFLGLIMGDHSKSGINTMFTTGTIVGTSCNVFGSGYLPKAIPSFTWLDSTVGPVEYRLEKAVDVARRVTARRNVEFTAADERLFRAIFERTVRERSAFTTTR